MQQQQQPQPLTKEAAQQIIKELTPAKSVEMLEELFSVCMQKGFFKSRHEVAIFDAALEMLKEKN